jgi:hypothetical protein
LVSADARVFLSGWWEDAATAKSIERVLVLENAPDQVTSSKLDVQWKYQPHAKDRTLTSLFVMELY